ncbi:MAG: tetratricopeptide repeat protein [bacterium]
MRFIAVYMFMALICFSSFIYAQIPEESQEYRDRADHELSRGHIQEAVQHYRESLILYPVQPDIYLILGQIYEYDLKEPEKGIFYYQKYLDFNPGGKDAEKAREFIEKQKKKGIYEKKYPKAFDVIDTPSSIESEESFKSREKLSDLQQTAGGIIQFNLKNKVMKYQIKINIWEEKGFIKKFNELARVRACPLETDVAAKRQALREERNKVTKNINYRKEAIKEMKIMALLKAMSSIDIDLNCYPDELTPDDYIESYKIITEKEDRRFFHLTMEFSVNTDKIKKKLKKAGFQEEAREISISLLNAEPQLRDTLENFIYNHSKYVALLDAGPRKIYTSPDLFSKEIAAMRVGPYGFIPRAVGKDTLSFEVKKIE